MSPRDFGLSRDAAPPVVSIRLDAKGSPDKAMKCEI